MSQRPRIERPDVERALERYLVEQRITRRELLERISVLGAAVALAPIVAACSGGAASASPVAVASPTAVPPTTAPTATTAPTPTPEPTPIPSPESDLIVYNWLDYIGEDVIPSFEEKYPIKVKYELFEDIEVAYTKLGADGNGYDISFPTSVDIPRFREAGHDPQARALAASRTSSTSGRSGRTRATTRTTTTPSRTCGGRPGSATTRSGSRKHRPARRRSGTIAGRATSR